ncbi:MAG: hypothetical protein M1837_002348 [Sclerophora amabilis]|nr:MAG: hypothetical protein M1837_002348 [Sclerophora amabilis]
MSHQRLGQNANKLGQGLTCSRRRRQHIIRDRMWNRATTLGRVAIMIADALRKTLPVKSAAAVLQHALGVSPAAHLCATCGAGERLDPLNRGKDVAHRLCRNVNLQINKPKRTLLGTSNVAGYGLFAGETVKAGEYLGEYSGEVISSQEAERRGGLYDRRAQVIDATRAGNKFRFINNTRRNENCKAKVLLANGTHRIAMFACKDLEPGDELFFNYGYTGSALKYVLKEIKGPENEVASHVARRKARGTTRTAATSNRHGTNRMQAGVPVWDAESSPEPSPKKPVPPVTVARKSRRSRIPKCRSPPPRPLDTVTEAIDRNSSDNENTDEEEEKGDDDDEAEDEGVDDDDDDEDEDEDSDKDEEDVGEDDQSEDEVMMDLDHDVDESEDEYMEDRPGLRARPLLVETREMKVGRGIGRGRGRGTGRRGGSRGIRRGGRGRARGRGRGRQGAE